MSPARVLRLAALGAALTSLLAPGPARADGPAVRYRVALDEIARAQASPRCTVEIAAAPARLELSFPAWLPGAYELRFFGRDVGAIEAADEQGRALRVVREGPSRVRIEGHADGARVTVRYRTSAELLSDDGADVGPDHAYLNPGAILPAVRGREDAAHELVLEDVPRGWRVLTPEGRPRLSAPSYAALIDQPVEAVDGAELISTELAAAGARFVVALHVDAGARERAQRALPAIARDLARIAEAQRALAGALPFSRYLVVMHLSDRAARLAALEHGQAASIVATPRLLGPEDYPELLHVLSHELFHAWNARRLVPAELAAYDLERVQPSAALWITEGLTEHVSLVALGQAGLLSRAELAQALEEALTRARYAERAGLSLSTLSRMAFAAPTSLAADPDAYYAVGHVVSMAIVAALLDRTGGRVGVEQLLAALLPPPGAAPRLIDLAALGRALDALAPAPTGEPPLSASLVRWVDEPFSLSRLVPVLAKVGLSTEAQRRERLDLAALADGEPPQLRVLEPGGAFARAGAVRGDQVLRIDGQPAHTAGLLALARTISTAPVRVDLIRGGEPLALLLRPRKVEEVLVKLAPEVLAPHARRAATQLARLLGGLPRR